MCTENHVCLGRSQLRRSECRVTHTNTLATALTPLRRRRGLPRESPLLRLRACRLGYEPEPASPPSWGDGPLKCPWVLDSAAGRCYNNVAGMSQLPDWKSTLPHTCADNHVYFGRIHGSQLLPTGIRTYVQVSCYVTTC